MKFAIMIVLVTLGCKKQPKAKPAPATEPLVTAPAAPSPTAPGPGDAPAVAIDAAPIDAPTIDAAPTRSELAAAERATFFTKVTKASKHAGTDCAKLAAELDRFAAQIPTMTRLRGEITGDQVAVDDLQVKMVFKVVTEGARACPDEPGFERFLNAVGEVP